MTESYQVGPEHRIEYSGVQGINQFSILYSILRFRLSEEIPEKIESSMIEDPGTPVADQVVKELNEKNAKTEITKKTITKRTQSRGTVCLFVLRRRSLLCIQQERKPVVGG